MKKFLCIMISLMIFVSSFACYYVSAEESELTLNVFNWGEYIDDGSENGSFPSKNGKDVIKEFEKYYLETFKQKVNVVYSTYENNEDMYAKIKAGGSNYDVIIPSDYMISRMISEDMLEKLNYSNIPNYKYIDEQFKNDSWKYDATHEYSVPYLWGTLGIVYNSKYVKGDVSKWDILWDETYKNKVLMYNNPRDTFAVALAKIASEKGIGSKILNTKDATYWKYAYEALVEQKDKVNPTYVSDEIFNKMESGEAYLAVCYYGDYMVMASNNEDIKFGQIIGQTSNKFVDAMCIPKGAANKELAEKFIDFMCRKDIALCNAEFTAYSSPSKQVMETPYDDENGGYHYYQDPMAYPSETIMSQYEEYLYLGEDTQEIMDSYWNRLKKQSGSVWIYIAIGVVVVGAIAAIVVKKVKSNRAERLFIEE